MNQCFLGTSVPTEENEAADVFVEENMTHMIVFVCIFVNLERI